MSYQLSGLKKQNCWAGQFKGKNSFAPCSEGDLLKSMYAVIRWIIAVHFRNGCFITWDRGWKKNCALQLERLKNGNEGRKTSLFLSEGTGWNTRRVCWQSVSFAKTFLSSARLAAKPHSSETLESNKVWRIDTIVTPSSKIWLWEKLCSLMSPGRWRRYGASKFGAALLGWQIHRFGKKASSSFGTYFITRFSTYHWKMPKCVHQIGVALWRKRGRWKNWNSKMTTQLNFFVISSKCKLCADVAER